MKLLILFLVAAVVASINAESDDDWSNLEHVLPTMKARRFGVPMPHDSKIIGGADNYLGQTPYQVTLKISNSKLGGGSILSTTWVMTAAHCIDNTSATAVVIRAGSLNTSTGGVTRTSNLVIPHPNYNSTSVNNDIGLVRVSSAFVFDNNIQAIRLPRRSQVGTTFEGFTAQASGWGKTSDNSTTSSVLKNVNVTVIANSVCATRYVPGVINSCKLCTSTQNGTQGICQGDSGGPLTIIDTDSLRTQIGITSVVSKSGCQTSTPNGFERVTCHLDWISANTGITIQP